SETVDYELRLPQRPVPLDVYFLVDTSNSMYETLAGLRRSIQGIINGLAEEQIDVQFGLGEYRAYPYSCPPGQDKNNFVYRQDEDIAPVGPALEEALESLTPDAGGFYDSHLGALYQAATGAGQDVFPSGTQNEADVDAGQDATFREKALRVVINATDEVFGRETPDEGIGQNITNPSCALQPTPDIPSFDEVITALSEREIKQVGLSISNTAESSYRDLATVARGTDTEANVPVDCNGDGEADIPSGAPLVCRLRPTGSQDGLNLVPAVVGLLNSVQDQVDVGLKVTKGDAVVDNLSPLIYPSVLLQTAKSLRFQVDFHCSRSQAGKKFEVDLAADSSVPFPNAVSDATVICQKLPPEKKKKKPPVVAPLVPPLIPTVAALAAAPPPPPPPTVSNLSSASQAQSQAQAQGATATQEQKEPQLALAQAYFQAQDDADYETELAMTAYHGAKDYPPAGAMFAIGFVVVSLMGSGLVVMRRRERRYVKPAWVERDRRY
ncbi:MAG: VWA domain-containing protein, partial [Actinobacteria bacterium]|nr:VWA domain-containing protein [Actinomycetota bacterium]